MPHPAEGPQALSADKVAQLLAAAQSRPQLADIPWHEDESVLDGAPVLRDGAARWPRAGDAAPAVDPVRSRIRDRYISVRFAGVARGAADLENPTRVIKAARLAFEDGEGEAALELLQLAIAQNPVDPSLRIAELDLAWRSGERDRFLDAAHAFRALFPRSVEWPEIARLAHSVAPEEGLFAPPPGAARSGEDGPPRWLQPPWDAAAPRDAAEFHRAMVGAQGDGR